jgi:chromate reductase
MGASGGAVGTARMQYDLRKIMLFLNANVLVKPEIFIGLAQTKFDAAGELTDEATRRFIADQMRALRTWTLRINGSRETAAPLT